MKNMKTAYIIYLLARTKREVQKVLDDITFDIFANSRREDVNHLTNALGQLDAVEQLVFDMLDSLEKIDSMCQQKIDELDNMTMDTDDENE